MSSEKAFLLTQILFLLVLLATILMLWKRTIRKNDSRLQDRLKPLNPSLAKPAHIFGLSSTWKIPGSQEAYFLQYQAAKRGHDRYFELWIPFSSPMKFSICSKRGFSNFSKNVNSRFLEIGDPTFDTGVSVQTNKPRELRSYLLRNECRAIVQETLRPNVLEISSDGRRMQARVYMDVLTTTDSDPLHDLERVSRGLLEIRKQFSGHPELIAGSAS